MALAVAGVLPAMASAEPIRWSYSSSGVDKGFLRLTPDQGTKQSNPGEPTPFFADGRWEVIGTPPAGALGDIGEWPVTVTVTDELSGEVGQFAVGYRVTVDINQYGDIDRLFAHAPEPFSARLRLGRHEYRFETEVDEDYDVPLTVTVREAAEPFTGALAGIGLAVVGVVRVRRWFAAKFR